MIGCNEEGLPGVVIYGETTPGFEKELWKYYWQNSDYAVSTFGRVYSCQSKIFLKPYKTGRYGHLQIQMSHLGAVTLVYVHRMVAEMFIPNPDGLLVVRHLDGDPTNNVVWNLAWGTQRDNWEDSVRHGTAAAIMTSRPVIAISKSDGSQIPFPSQHDAARELNLNLGHIWQCLNGQRSHTSGYKFIYGDETNGSF